MSTISHINPQNARFNPGGEFEHPRALVEEVGLTRGQKLAALQRWAFEVERRLASAEEGMPSNDMVAGDLKLLEEIRMAERELQPAD